MVAYPVDKNPGRIPTVESSEQGGVKTENQLIMVSTSQLQFRHYCSRDTLAGQLPRGVLMVLNPVEEIGYRVFPQAAKLGGRDQVP